MHVARLLREMEMETCRSLTTSGVKPSSLEEEPSEPLIGAAVTLYRSGAARCNYLSVDRPDIPLETKELCKKMSQATEADMVALKHLCRYVKGRPR